MAPYTEIIQKPLNSIKYLQLAIFIHLSWGGGRRVLTFPVCYEVRNASATNRTVLQKSNLLTTSSNVKLKEET